MSDGMEYMKKNFEGKWKVDKSEGFEDFLKEMGVNVLIRKMASLGKPVSTIVVEDDTISITTVTPVKTMVDKFKLDGSEIEKEIDGVKLKGGCSFENNKLTTKFAPVDPDAKIKPQTVIRELDGDALLMTILVGDVVCKRWHKKLEE